MVTVPDSFSPVVVTPVSNSTFLWLGTDQNYHVSYDLQLTNGSQLPATLTMVQVIDAEQPDNVLASISGAQLVDPGCAYGDCNRLRMLPSSKATDTVLPPGQSRALLVDVAFESLKQAPAAVVHRLFLTGQATPHATQPTPISYLAAPFNISAGKPLFIAPPQGNQLGRDRAACWSRRGTRSRRARRWGSWVTPGTPALHICTSN